MQQINAAYDEIQRQRAESSHSGSDSSYSGREENKASGIYVDIRNKINQRKFREAEELLSTVSEFDRTADWHFLTSVCLMQKGRIQDAIRELEIACSMDPANMEYQKAKEAFNRAGGAYGSTYYENPRPNRRTSTDDACDCCANLICLDCLCECMGGDLIACC
jgi:tetratricopeptide (TPR) repeat protein